MMHACRSLFLLAGLVLSAFFAPMAQAQRPDALMDRMNAQLVAQGPAVPGQVVELALYFEPLPGWHGYWSNPGDAGQGMQLEWALPVGWQAGEPEYPVPQTLTLLGIMNHVYKGDYAVLVPLRVPAEARPGGSVPVAVKAQWLACSDELCVPQWGTLATRITLSEAGGVTEPRFDGWRAAVAPLLDSRASFAISGSTLRLGIPLPASMPVTAPHVFVSNERLVDYAAPQRFWRDGDRIIAEIALKGAPDRPQEVSGIFKLDSAGGGVRFAADAGAVAIGGQPLGDAASAALAPLWLLLGGALLGGLLLNIMPCVFPILSLKALTLAKAGESEAQARREGLEYTAGVVLAVLALGGLMLALRAAGNEIGWAFQLQEPGVVVALLAVALAITANFLGLYDLPAISISRSGRPAGSFATGLLAAFVATPCTGPFMAAAMGAALLLPVPQALLLFAVLGLGLALPFLLLGFVPPLRRRLPKPGRWMGTFKTIMAVPMGLTALALVWLCWRLGGWPFAVLATVLGVLFTALLAAGFRRWLLGRPAAGVLLAALAVPAALGLALLPRLHDGGAGAASTQGVLASSPFSEDALARARAEGRPVFAYFTADWCLTCKVNEKVAIEREATRDAFKKAGVVTLVGDWTRRDADITRFLAAHGAAGVPLYLWYPPGGDGQQLPQVLTPDSLVTLADQLPR